MPAATASSTTPSMSASKANAASEKVLTELLAKLSLTKEQADINAATASIATFINGEIETKDAPTK
jgi:elongation factor 3